MTKRALQLIDALMRELVPLKEFTHQFDKTLTSDGSLRVEGTVKRGECNRIYIKLAAYHPRKEPNQMPPKYKRAETEIGNPDPRGRDQRDTRPTSDKIKTFDKDAGKRISDSDGTGRNDYDQKIEDAKRDMGA
jgi:hypothetical protein